MYNGHCTEMEISIVLKRHLYLITIILAISFVTSADKEYVACRGGTWDIRPFGIFKISITKIEQSVACIVTDREIVALHIQAHNPPLHLQETIGSDYGQF